MSKRKMTKIRYRFPKFHPDWKEDEFKDIFDFHQTNTFSRSQMNNRREFTRNIHYGDILTKYGNILSDLQEVPYINKDISLLKFKEESYLKNGDIIIADTAEDLTVGKAIEVQNIDGKVLSGLHTILCRPKFKFAPRFLGYNLNSSSYRRNLIPLVVGVKVCSISKTNISKTLVKYPDDINEQQKIADCLSSIDDLIFAEEKKLSLLNDYKKGWMQKLFPIEGRNVPEWRFPEFRASGEWENTTIGKIADYENGKAHENNIINNGKYIVVNSKFISTEGEIIKYTNEANLLAYKGDILMVLSDVPNGRALSKCYLVDKDNLYTVNQRVCRITPKKINSILFFYTINRNKYFLAFDDGVKQTNLRKNDVLHCSVVIPKDSNEQNKIADFLSGIDELLCRQIDKIEALKKHKKALMQGLFPVAEEV